MKQVLQINNFIDSVESEKYITWIDDNLNDFLFLKHRQRHMLRFGYDQEYPKDAHKDLKVLGTMEDSIITMLNNLIDVVKEKTGEQELYVGSFFISKHLPGSAVPAHSDGHKNFNQPLHYSALVYLNELPDSGSLFFNVRNLSIHPKTGDLIVFDTHSPLNIHSVPDVSGERYSIPVWLTRNSDFNILAC